MTAQVNPTGSGLAGARLFTYPLTYRVILAVRHFLTDIVVTMVFASLVVVWEIVVNTASPTHVQVVESTGWVAWWTNDAMIPLLPAFIAAAVFFMGLRIGARVVDDESLRGAVTGQLIQAQVNLSPTFSVTAVRDEADVFSLVFKVHKRYR